VPVHRLPHPNPLPAQPLRAALGQHAHDLFVERRRIVELVLNGKIEQFIDRRDSLAVDDLPVIGVPLKSSLSVLDGLDALLAITQMPPGVPVAAVGVDNARNAAALAVRILSA